MRRPQILFVVMAMLISIGAVTGDEPRPNFVFFIADDISHDDLGCYGHPTMQTPHIDRLAESGLRFNNAYLTISSCSPSRCSIITGRYPHNTGAPELHTTLPEGQVLFPGLLKNAGYYTALSGKHHMGNYASEGFDLVSGGKGPGKEGDWVDLVNQRPRDKPFFFWFASTDAHRSWAQSDEAPDYQLEDMVVPPYLIDDAATREDLTGYYHEVSRFDHYIGKVVEELERQGVLDDTVIIVAADNGRPFPRCKTRLYDSGIKTPFVVHNPKHVTQGVTDRLVSTIDISATVLDLAGIEKDARIQGMSFAPILNDPAATVREVVFAEHNWHVYK
ncbi:MAG: sulfatase, partial [Planctomycetota bacterium]